VLANTIIEHCRESIAKLALCTHSAARCPRTNATPRPRRCSARYRRALHAPPTDLRKLVGQGSRHTGAHLDRDDSMSVSRSPGPRLGVRDLPDAIGVTLPSHSRAVLEISAETRRPGRSRSPPAARRSRLLEHRLGREREPVLSSSAASPSSSQVRSIASRNSASERSSSLPGSSPMSSSDSPAPPATPRLAGRWAIAG